MNDTIALKPAIVNNSTEQMDATLRTAYGNSEALAQIQTAQIKEGYTADEYSQEHLRLNKMIGNLCQLMDVNTTFIRV